MDVENLLEKVSDNLAVGRVFGAAYEKDGTLIIPVAIVVGGGGGGSSRARPGKPTDGEPATHDVMPQDSGLMDGGGGFGGVVLPSGAYIVKGDQVRWIPAVDMTIVIVASVSLVRVLARAWSRRRRRRG